MLQIWARQRGIWPGYGDRVAGTWWRTVDVALRLICQVRMWDTICLSACRQV